MKVVSLVPECVSYLLGHTATLGSPKASEFTPVSFLMFQGVPITSLSVVKRFSFSKAHLKYQCFHFAGSLSTFLLLLNHPAHSLNDLTSLCPVIGKYCDSVSFCRARVIYSLSLYSWCRWHNYWHIVYT